MHNYLPQQLFALSWLYNTYKEGLTLIMEEASVSKQLNYKNKRKFNISSKIKYGIMVALFLLPAFAFYGTFNVYGIIKTFQYSTLKWTGVGNGGTFIGLGNYKNLLADPTLWHSLGNNLILVVASISIQLPLGLLLALLLNTKIKGVKFYRTIYFMPMLLSTVATGILWSLMYDANFGIINSVLDTIGLGKYKTGWIGNEKTALISVIITICWQFVPFYMILMKAGLTNIPEELYESASLDGATGFKRFWFITLPLMTDTIRTSATLSLVGSLKYFDLIYVMTGGGPNRATELMATYMYKKSFVEFDMGYASSIAAFMFMVSLTITIVVQFFTKSREPRERRARL
jgi:raffinose/stachyose/melibiose transport system permease protein